MKTKSALQTGNKPYWKNAILLAITALALSASPGSRAAELCGCLRTWDNSGTGDWFDPSNWSPYHDYIPGCGEQPVCPIDGGTTEADINNGGTAQINTTAQTAHACEVFLGKDSGQSGNLAVDHGTLDQCNAMWVGYNGKGTLSITNGGSVNTDGAVGIAAETGSSGAATVDGINSTWTFGGTLYVAGTNPIPTRGGTGLLTVTNSGTVSAANVYVYKSGTLTGNGTVTTANGVTTIEGTLAPSGGTFTFNGDVSWLSSAVTEYNFSPSSLVNKLEISGMASLDGRLSVTVAADTPPGRYTLLHASNLQFSFSSYSIKVPGCLGWSIVYDHDNGYVYLDLAVNCN